MNNINTQTLETLVLGVLVKNKQNDEIFTIYDVTKEIRDIVGTGVNIPHSDVRNLLATSLQIMEYIVDNFDETYVMIGSETPRLFHPRTVTSSDAIETYADKFFNKPVNNTNPIVNTLNNTVTKNPVSPKKTAIPTSDTNGVVRVFSSPVKDSGLTGSVWVTYVPSANVVTITDKKPLTNDPNSVSQQRQVGTKNDIRFNKNTFGIDSSKTPTKVNAQSGTILISLA